jgi:hypothetical protein
MALVAEQIPAASAPEIVVETAILGARILDAKIVDGKIVDGRIVGGRVVDTHHLGQRTMRALHMDAEHKSGEVVAVIGLGLALLLMYLA